MNFHCDVSFLFSASNHSTPRVDKTLFEVPTALKKTKTKGASLSRISVALTADYPQNTQ